MLVNVSYSNKAVSRKVDLEVGMPYTLKERFRLKGIGSSKLIITETSIQIHNLLILDSNRNQCNIELRPNGIIVGFRSLLESYALVIPYYKLVLYKGRAEEAKAKDRSTHKFMQKIIEAKNNVAPERIEDL
jgi:hypothetical protein